MNYTDYNSNIVIIALFFNAYLNAALKGILKKHTFILMHVIGLVVHSNDMWFYSYMVIHQTNNWGRSLQRRVD